MSEFRWKKAVRTAYGFEAGEYYSIKMENDRVYIEDSDPGPYMSISIEQCREVFGIVPSDSEIDEE